MNQYANGLNELEALATEQCIRNDELQRRNAQLETVLAQMRKGEEAHMNEITQLRQQVAQMAELEAENSGSVQKNDEHIRRIAELEGSVFAHKYRIAELEAALSETKRTASASELRIQELEAEVAAHKTAGANELRIQELEVEVAAHKTRNSELNRVVHSVQEREARIAQLERALRLPGTQAPLSPLRQQTAVAFEWGSAVAPLAASSTAERGGTPLAGGLPLTGNFALGAASPALARAASPAMSPVAHRQVSPVRMSSMPVGSSQQRVASPMRVLPLAQAATSPDRRVATPIRPVPSPHWPARDVSPMQQHRWTTEPVATNFRPEGSRAAPRPSYAAPWPPSARRSL